MGDNLVRHHGERRLNRNTGRIDNHDSDIVCHTPPEEVFSIEFTYTTLSGEFNCSLALSGFGRKGLRNLKLGQGNPIASPLAVVNLLTTIAIATTSNGAPRRLLNASNPTNDRQLAGRGYCAHLLVSDGDQPSDTYLLRTLPLSQLASCLPRPGISRA